MRTDLRTRIVGILFVGVVTCGSGCVAGQTIAIDYAPEMGGKPATAVAVAVQAQDQRPYIVNKDKKPSFIGIYRAGYGNTWSVTTRDQQPFAANVARDVAKDLQALGYQVTDPSSADRRLEITVVDWNFSTYINGNIWYEFLVVATDSQGKELARSTVKDESVIRGSVWVGPKYAFERDVPKIYATAIRRLVRENPEIRGALEPGAALVPQRD